MVDFGFGLCYTARVFVSVVDSEKCSLSEHEEIFGGPVLASGLSSSKAKETAVQSRRAQRMIDFAARIGVRLKTECPS
jgi:hypothetical protein